MPTKASPADLGELICRITPPAVSGIQVCQPVVASAIELADDGPLSRPSQWVILPRITNSTVQLFHSRPLRARKLAVRVDSPTGEIVNIVLAVGSTFARGELYETTANCYRP